MSTCLVEGGFCDVFLKFVVIMDSLLFLLPSFFYQVTHSEVHTL